MCKVQIGERVLTANKGERLIDLLQRYGIESPHPCAGRGSCGKCKATVDGEEILTCKYVIEGDITVTLRGRSGLDVTVLKGFEGVISSDAFFASFLVKSKSLSVLSP